MGICDAKKEGWLKVELGGVPNVKTKDINTLLALRDEKMVFLSEKSLKVYAMLSRSLATLFFFAIFSLALTHLTIYPILYFCLSPLNALSTKTF